MRAKPGAYKKELKRSWSRQKMAGHRAIGWGAANPNHKGGVGGGVGVGKVPSRDFVSYNGFRLDSFRIRFLTLEVQGARGPLGGKLPGWAAWWDFLAA